MKYRSSYELQKSSIPRRRLKLIVNYLVGCAFLLGSFHAARSNERLGAWEMVCDDQDAKQSCRAIQRQSITGGSDPALIVTVLLSDDGKTPIGIVSIPAGGYLVPGIEIAIDKRQIFKLLVETCNSTGCHAGFAFKGRVLAAFERGRQAKIRFWTTKNKPVEIGLSVSGFDDVLRTLRKPSKS